MSDLIERLRNVRGSFVIPIEAPNVFGWADEAADELERLTAQRNKAIEAGANEVSYRVELEAENEHLRAALDEITKLGRVCKGFELCQHESCGDSAGAVLIALEALQGDSDE